MLYNPRVKHSKIFLGGTTGNTNWRRELIDLGAAHGFPAEAFFNPVVEHWDEAAQELEAQMKADRSVLQFYYLGDTGTANGAFLSFYSLHEATMGLYDLPEHTVVLFDYEGLVSRAAKRLRKVHNELKERFSIHFEPPIFQSKALAFPYLLTRISHSFPATG